MKRRSVATVICCLKRCLSVDAKTKSEYGSSVWERVGQPTPETHPHLLAQGEISHGISASEFKERRKRLLQALPNNSMVMFPAASEKFMSVDVPYPFRQNSDLFYLTGLTQPGAVLLLDKTQLGGDSQYQGKEYLFVQERDPQKETWEGSSCGVEEAQSFFGIANADTLEHLAQFLSNRLSHNPQVYFDISVNPQVNYLLRHLNDSEIKSLLSNRKPQCAELALQRLIKSPSEQQLLKRSCEIIADSMVACMQKSHPGMRESILAAQIEYECALRGAERMSFPPVVASGNHSTTLHYLQNSDVAKDGDFILMDVGCEWHAYCSDVTRTWPVNGKFSRYQQELYELVLDVHQKCKWYKHVISVRTSLDAIHVFATKWMKEGLEELEIIKEKHSNNEDVSSFFPHAIGHYLGLDVHDTHMFEKSFALKPGMVITIEPGLYIPRSNLSVPEPYRGIGIRIEDDILITEQGISVLSENVPKKVKDIESLLSGK
eukprot:jgi/Galph1/5888/GphlegSOOS_G4474.1